MEWQKRWIDERTARGLVSVDDDKQRLRDHILPSVGELAIAQVTKGDARRLVQHLDDKVRRGDLSWKTASHVWTLTRTMFRDACSAKRIDLVVRDDDPTDRVEGPDRGEDLARTYLYPSEFQQLITCKDVPIEWRRLYVMAAYTLSRAGELAALRWDAVDRERGVIHFRQATDRRTTGRMKSTKTGKARRVPIEPTLKPLLEALLLEAKDAYVIHVPVSKRADMLREHMKLPGLTRAELFPPPTDGSVAATWAPLTYHDLRGCGVTWMALRGDEPLVIQQRAGHANFATTQRYLREAETLGTDAGQPFPPLPTELCQSRRVSLRESVTARKDRAGHGVRTWTAKRSESPFWPGNLIDCCPGVVPRRPSISPHYPSFPAVSGHVLGHGIWPPRPS
jgi:integrase